MWRAQIGEISTLELSPYSEQSTDFRVPDLALCRCNLCVLILLIIPSK